MRLLTCTLFCAAVMCMPSQQISFAQPMGQENKGGPPSGGAGKGMAKGGKPNENAFGRNPGNYQGRTPGRITDPSTARSGMPPRTSPSPGFGQHPGNYQGRIPGRITDPSTARPGTTPGVYRNPGFGTQPGTYQGQNPARLGPGGLSSSQVPQGSAAAPESRMPGNFKKRDLGQMSPRNPGKPLNPGEAASVDAPGSEISSQGSMPSEVLPRVPMENGQTGLQRLDQGGAAHR